MYLLKASDVALTGFSSEFNPEALFLITRFAQDGLVCQLEVKE